MKHIVFLSAICLLLAGCGGKSDGAAKTAGGDAPVQEFAQQGDLAGAHILIAYAGAERAAQTVARTREEARAEAEALNTKLLEDPSQFEAMAKEWSDGPSGKWGGRLNAWKRGAMAVEFDRAVADLEVGAITSKPVETVFGFHIIRRDKLEVPHYGGYAIVVGYKGAPGMKPTVQRTKEEAQARVEELKKKVKPRNFTAMAETYNDLEKTPSFMGAFTQHDQMPAGLKDAIAEMPFDGVAGPFEFPMGFAMIQRSKLERRKGAHILIHHKESKNASGAVIRTKEEALQLAQDLIDKLNKGEREFADLAREFSDGPTASHGGDLGFWFRGMMVPPFETAFDAMKDGDVSQAPVESPFGYHVIRRDSL